MSTTEKLIQRLDALLDKVEPLIPSVSQPEIEFNGGAYRCIRTGKQLFFRKITGAAGYSLSDLQCIEKQKQRIIRNTEQFLANLPANNVLLWGPKGTGKSSLMKALLNRYQTDGLNLIEVSRNDLHELNDIIDCLAEQTGHFILYCDDLSFEANETTYKALKVILDGGLTSMPENILIYASSNRRHLLPEYHDENNVAGNSRSELHMNEAVEEKIALSERFGMWLAFHPFDQTQYLKIVNYWLNSFRINPEEDDALEKNALRWALERGSRSGRTAWQFAKDWAGQQQMKAKNDAG